jgi:hypothetical protein
MSKLTISDAAEQLGVSKEAIHNRIRRGSLQSVTEDGVKLVVLDGDLTLKTPSVRVSNKRAVPNDDRYYRLLEEQNAKLQQKVETLESETRTLRDQKEQMLVQERKKIEQIYRDKDEQLKSIINAISTKFMLNSPVEESNTEELFEAEIEEERDKTASRLVSLNKYLKMKNLSKKKVLKIKEKFEKNSKEDGRIITLGKKLYIDLDKYDYSDLI